MTTRREPTKKHVTVIDSTGNRLAEFNYTPKVWGASIDSISKRIRRMGYRFSIDLITEVNDRVTYMIHVTNQE
jgi:hypothetical protein